MASVTEKVGFLSGAVAKRRLVYRIIDYQLYLTIMRGPGLSDATEIMNY